jgi:hypothetical protein
MSAARIVVLSIALGAGGVTAALPGASAKQAERPAHARQTATPGSALRGNAVASAVDNIFEHQARRDQRRAIPRRHPNDGTEVTEGAAE